MAFGMTYELAIVVFIVLMGLVYIVGGYENLVAPAVQITEAVGIFLIFMGFVKRDYDTLFSGVLLIVVGVAMSLSLPTSEKGILAGAGAAQVYASVVGLTLQNPVLLVLVLLFLAYLLSKS